MEVYLYGDDGILPQARHSAGDRPGNPLEIRQKFRASWEEFRSNLSDLEAFKSTSRLIS